MYICKVAYIKLTIVQRIKKNCNTAYSTIKHYKSVLS
jgi:hypothetical protein